MLSQVLVSQSSNYASTGGISGLGLDVKLLILQIASFVLVLWVLRRYAFGPIVKTLDERYKKIENSISNAEKLEKQNRESEKKAQAILKDARIQAEATISKGREEASSIVKEAEDVAGQKAARMIKDAETKLAGDIVKAKSELKQDILSLIKRTTAILIDEKMDDSRNDKLIEEAMSATMNKDSK